MTRQYSVLAGALAAALVLSAGYQASAGSAVSVAAKDAPPLPSPRVIAFDHFMKVSSPICSYEPSGRCVDAGWQFADADHDGTITLAEFEAVRAAFQDWMSWKGDEIPTRTRLNVALGMAIFDMFGMQNIFTALNTSGTGKLTRAELLADVHLDNRPLGQVLLDPKAVDRAAIAHKLGAAGEAANALIEKSGQGSRPQQ